MRPELFAAIAHDLKNELAWLEGALERSVHESPSPQTDLSTIHKQCVKLRRRLIEFLTVYGHETGSVKAFAEPCALHGFLQEVAASSGGERAVVEIENAPSFWIMDERLVALAMAAALNNASNFSRKMVKLGAETRDGYLVLYVEDDGPGLGSGGTPEGTGLGTVVARMVAQAHDDAEKKGNVHLFNLPQGGCRFELLLPP